MFLYQLVYSDDTVPTMDNTIYKLFSLLVLTCLSDLVLTYHYTY